MQLTADVSHRAHGDLHAHPSKSSRNLHASTDAAEMEHRAQYFKNFQMTQFAARGEHHEERRKVILLEKSMTLGQAATTTWHNYYRSLLTSKQSSLTCLIMLFTVTIFVIVGLAVMFQYQQLEEKFNAGLIRRQESEQEAGPRWVPPQHPVCSLQGINAQVAPPRRWPKVEKKNDQEGTFDSHSALLRSVSTFVDDSWAAIFQNIHGDDELASATSPRGGAHGGNAITAGGHTSELKKAGHICPFVHAMQQVNVQFDGRFVQNPLGPDMSGNLKLTLNNDVGQSIFSLSVAPIQHGFSENLKATERRHMKVGWVGHDDAPPLASVRPLNPNSDNEKEIEAVRMGGRFGIWDMNDRLMSLIKCHYQADDDFDDGDHQLKLFKWEIYRIYKDEDADTVRLRPMGSVHRASNPPPYIPAIPSNPLDVSMTYLLDGRGQKIAVMRAVGGGPETQNNLAIMMYEEADMILAVANLVGCLVFQANDAEDIEKWSKNG